MPHPLNFESLLYLSPPTISPTDSVAEALDLIASQQNAKDEAVVVDYILVTINQELLGKVTGDALIKLCAEQKTLETLTVEALVSPVETVIYYSQLNEISHLIKQLKGCKSQVIPVVNEQEKLVGILRCDRAWEAIYQEYSAAVLQRLETEKFLNRISQKMRQAKGIQDSFNQLTREIRDFLRSDRAFIYQLRGQGKHRVVSAATNRAEDRLLQFQLPGLAVTEQWYHKKELKVIQNINNYDINQKVKQALAEVEIGAHLIAPIVWSEQVWGLLVIAEREPSRCWREEEIELVKALAEKSAIALQEAFIQWTLRREIQKREQAQHHLEQRQQQLLKIANSVPGGIYQFSVTPEGVWSFPFANEGALNLFGIPTDVNVVEAQHWFNRIHPDDLEKVNSKIQLSLDHKTHWHCEFRVNQGQRLRLPKPRNAPVLTKAPVTVGQQIRWVEGIADVPDELPDGTVVFNGVVLDITQRKYAEQGWRTLIEASKNFTHDNFLASVVQYIANTLDVDWVMVSQKQGDTLQIQAIWGNGQLQPNFALSLAEESPCIEIVRSQNHSGLVYQEQVQAHFPDNEFLKAAGAEAYIGAPLLNWQGEVMGNLCIFHRQPFTEIYRIKSILDVFADRIAVELERTEALNNLQALNEDLESQVAARTADLQNRNQELDSFFSVSLDLLCIADLNGYFRRLNRRWEEMFGYSQTELTQYPFSYFVHPEDQEKTKQAFQHLRQGQPVKYFINRYRCADHSYRWLEWSAVPVGDKIYAAAHDITRRKQDQEYLQQTNAELERANRLKDEFLANMSHELRTPLNSILGMSEGLQDQLYGQLNSKQLQSLDTIQRSGQHLLELINDILDLSKIEAGKLELQIDNISISHLCHTTISLVREMAQKKDIRLKMELPERLPMIRGDEQRLRQALLNLLSNAIKFTPEQGKITFKVTLINEGADIAFSVIDTGIGIHEENLPKLFEPFMQIKTSQNTTQGTGLGLSLVKRLAHLHGGDVSVQSTFGEGSCFTLIIPYCQPEEAITEAGAYHDHNLNRTDEQIPSFKVLLADDDEANLLTTGSYLRAKGYEVVEAKNGRSAIALTLQEQPDVILMDIQMPELNGLEAIHQLRAKPYSCQTPIIALTAFAMAGDEEKCLAAGANHYLAKPVRLKELVNMIQSNCSGNE